jgi:tetratricopeptide (TPR) repeat protein
MKLLIPILILLFGIDPGNIGKSNSAKSKAKEAYVKGDYKTAIENYKYLTDSLGVKEDEVMMNLAHSYFNLNDTANALTTYQKLLTSQNKMLKSNAYQQLGVLSNRQEKLEEALANFKEALKTDPTNEDARYNYEMVKKKLEEKKKQEKKNNPPKEPSEFAKKLKAQADLLVLQREYKSAYDLMIGGLQKDQSVAFYQTFIDRTKIVASIHK